MKLVSAKCPNCGANLKVNSDDESVKCEFCEQTIIINDAIACYKLKVSGTVSVNGISSNADLIESGNELISIGEFLKAKKCFKEFSEKCPKDYQGWLGLLICRTRNFRIKDNNILFQKDVENYYSHFKSTAPKEISDQYYETIDRYFDPEKYIRLEQAKKLEEERKAKERYEREQEERRRQIAEEKEKLRQENERIRKEKEAEEELKRQERKKAREERRANSQTYATFTKVSSKALFVLYVIWNVLLYISGAFLILGGIFSDFPFGEKIVTILLGLSLFQCFYQIFEIKFKVSTKLLKVLRWIIPIFLIIMIGSLYPENNNENNNPPTEEQATTVVGNNEEQITTVVTTEPTTTKQVTTTTTTTKKRVVYEVNYNEAGQYGKKQEYEGYMDYFYYIPADTYEVKRTSSHEKICFLWVYYKKSYKGEWGKTYNSKSKYEYSYDGQTQDVKITSDTMIYNSNDCNYEFVKK
ncbi:MAG: hypothetical protein IKP76_04280 [Bacilli bacterium]|nr:hypothetical protein [Bacilli bacterium]